MAEGQTRHGPMARRIKISHFSKKENHIQNQWKIWNIMNLTQMILCTQIEASDKLFRSNSILGTTFEALGEIFSSNWILGTKIEASGKLFRSIEQIGT